MNLRIRFSGSLGRNGRGCPLYAAALLVFCSLLTGCRTAQPYVTDSRLQRGLVIVLPGIEGRSQFNEAICRGLDEGRVDWAIELYDWTSIWGPLHNLRNKAGNREQAGLLADRITRYKLAYPNRPIVLVGQSGGAAIAVWTAEALPPSEEIDGIIMLAGALSPQYMLDQALAGTRRGIINFYSARDWMLLGVGTMIYGTMDGAHSESAGRVGFKLPDTDSRPRVYQKLFQIPWQRSMSEAGHVGLHLSSGAEEFVATYVAPFIIATGDWDEQLIGYVTGALEWPPATQPAASPASRTGPEG